MAQSGTYNFNLDIDEVIQEAMEMIGGEQTLGHEPQSARRSINLMLNDWQNRGVLLWNTDTTTVTVSSSVTTYDLDSSAIDALVVTFQPNSTSAETKLERKSFEEYHIIPNKFQTGRPTQYTVKRNLDNLLNIKDSFIVNTLILDHSFWYGYLDNNPKEIYEKYAKLQINIIKYFGNDLTKYNIKKKSDMKISI